MLFSNVPPEAEKNNKNFLSFGFRIFAVATSKSNWKIVVQNYINSDFTKDIELR